MRSPPERKCLRELTTAVSAFLARFDVLMKQPSTVERGRALASLANALDLANDSATHFGLKVSLPKIKRIKAAAEKAAEKAVRRTE